MSGQPEGAMVMVPRDEDVDRVMAVLNYWFDGSRRIDRNSEMVKQLAALAATQQSPISGEGADDDINWKAEWEAKSLWLIRLADAARPFADVAVEFDACGDGQPIGIKAASGRSDLSVGDLRALVQALAKYAPPVPSVSGGEDQVEAAAGGETWATMAAWCEETFGPVTSARTASRANEEMLELLANPDDVMEAADVCIVLSRYPGLAEAINAKMAINRARTWNLKGDGTGYHVKASISGEGGR